MIVRRELPEDRSAIFAVHMAAFGDSNAGDGAEARLVDDLRRDGDVLPGLSLVALLDGDPAYYRRFGFELAAPLDLLPPDPSWAPHFQVRRLTAYDPSLRGTFRHAPAFDRLEGGA